MPDKNGYDSPWKEILCTFFTEFMEFFFPDMAREIDWSRGYELLDKELRQITRESEIGFRLADHLVKVWRLDGAEAWVLVHVEVQGWKEKEFGHRVFVYHYRIHDLYKRPVVSLAVLADDNPNWYVQDYEQELWGCRTQFTFPMVKLLDFKKEWELSESSSNPFVIVTMAHLRTLETRKNDSERLRYKLALSKSLYQRGWDRQEIIDLYRFIDWIMALPVGLEQRYHEELVKYEEDVKMQYVTTAERIGIEKGREEGKQEGKQEGKREGKFEGKKETAINLLALGVLTEKQIAQATGLDIEDIRKMKKSL